MLNDGERSLLFFYEKVFPCDLFYRWLNVFSTLDGEFAQREFSTKKEQQFQRHLFFKDGCELKEFLRKTLPDRLDIGPVYSNVEERIAGEKEFVFDVDLSDYDGFRRCCEGANMCARCFPLAVLAVQVLDDLFASEFGWKHVLWVFSGRRGIHAWVSDKEVRSFDGEMRKAIVEFVRPKYIREKQLDLKQGRLNPMHHRLYEKFLLPFFEGPWFEQLQVRFLPS